MRNVATLGSYPVSSCLQAVMLLAVLLTHLAFMTSPFHVRMSAEQSHAVDSAVMAGSEAAATPAGWTTRNKHDGHCIIEWMRLDPQTTLAVFLAVALTAGPLALHLQILGTRPIARALGPPSSGDPQALLQVFRE